MGDPVLTTGMERNAFFSIGILGWTEIVQFKYDANLLGDRIGKGYEKILLLLTRRGMRGDELFICIIFTMISTC